MADEEKVKVAVLGAGPAGMAAAYSLAGRGVPVTVLEKEDQVGGLARTIRHQGFRFDLGSHRFFTKHERVRTFVEELLGDELITVSRSSKIIFQGRYFDYPPTFWNAFSGLGPFTSARIFGAYLKQRILPDRRETKTLEDWMTRQFGSVMYELFFKTYTEKVWGTPCREIAAIWATQRIQGMSLAAAIRQALLPADNPPASMIDRFLYPRLGIGRICEKMAEAFPEAVKLSTRVTGLRPDGERGWVVAGEGPSGKIQVTAEQVISTLPINELVKMLSPAPPPPVREAAAALAFRDLILVALMFDCEPLTAESWIYIPNHEIIFGRFHEPANFSRELSPPGQTSLVFDLFCFRTDPIWTWPDDQLTEAVVADLRKIGMVKAEMLKRIIGAKVIRAERAYPLHRLGYEEPLGVIKSYLDAAGRQGLRTVGREGQFAYLNIDHALVAGMLAAENALGARHEIDSVLADDSYLEAAGRVRASEASDGRKA